MFGHNFIRKQKDPFKSMGILYELAEQFVEESTPISLIAAYKVFATLQDNYPDKSYKGMLGVVRDKLDKFNLYENINAYEKQMADGLGKDEKTNITLAATIQPKLVGEHKADIKINSNLFENQDTVFDNMKVLYELADDFLKENTPISLIAAYKIFSTLQDNHPDKAYIASLGEATLKLKQLGLIQKILDYEKLKSEKSSSNEISVKNNFKSKL